MTFDVCLSHHLLSSEIRSQKKSLTHHLSHLISLPALLLKTKGPKRTIPSFDWNRKTLSQSKKLANLKLFKTWNGF